MAAAVDRHRYTLKDQCRLLPAMDIVNSTMHQTKCSEPVAAIVTGRGVAGGIVVKSPRKIATVHHPVAENSFDYIR